MDGRPPAAIRATVSWALPCAKKYHASAQRELMSHKIEIAPTGRASCRGCKKAVLKGDLRFGEEFANAYSEDGGMSFRYWHLACAAVKLANELAPVIASYEGDIP